MNRAKDNFLLKKEISPLLDTLSDSLAGKLFKSILHYVCSSKIDDITDADSIKQGEANMLFSMIRNTIDDNEARYEEILIAKRNAGHNGGIRSGEVRRELSVEANEADASNRSKRSKTKQTKQNEHDTVTDTDTVTVTDTGVGVSIHTPAENESYQRARYLEFKEWMRQNTPYCNDKSHFTSSTITEDEFGRLMDKYTPTQIAETLASLEASKSRAKYVNLYLTLRKWMKKDYSQ